MPNERGYSAGELCRITGATYRQLDYWVRRGLLVPRYASRGSGDPRSFDRSDLDRAVLLRLASAAKGLGVLDAGQLLEHGTQTLAPGLTLVLDREHLHQLTESLLDPRATQQNPETITQ